MKEFICIECPKGCHLKIDDELNVTGNTCPRGKKYAINEVTCPKRVITSTAVIKSK
jgi:CxxC motif-containing protein